MFRSPLDHVIIGCAVLEQGIRYVEERLGVAPQAGGRHAVMGTHNALLKLGARSYLEVIAIDPDAEPPARPRWFSLDEPAMREQLAAAPAPITWAVSNENLADACARVEDLGDILNMSRDALRGKITVAADGRLAWAGVLPAAIQWEAAEDGTVPHPCDSLPDRGCELLKLELSHPAAVLGNAGLIGLFRDLRVVGPVDLKPGPKRIAALIRSPHRDVMLD